MTEKDLDIAIEKCERIMEFDTRTLENPESENGYIFEKVYDLLQFLRQFQFSTDNVDDKEAISAQSDIPDMNVIIDTIKNAINASTGNDAYMVGLRNGMRWCWSALTDKEPEYEDIPPKQKNARVFQGIVVEYPSIWIYPEYKGKPYFSIKYIENGQGFIGYGTYKPEVLSEYLKKYFMLPVESKWIPCTPDTLPQEDGEYLVTIHWKNGGYYTDLLRYRAYLKEWKYENEIFGTIVAWQPKPKPYQERE